MIKAVLTLQQLDSHKKYGFTLQHGRMGKCIATLINRLQGKKSFIIYKQMAMHFLLLNTGAFTWHFMIIVYAIIRKTIFQCS